MSGYIRFVKAVINLRDKGYILLDESGFGFRERISNAWVGVKLA